METRRLVRMDSPGRPPRLSHSSWTMNKKTKKRPFELCQPLRLTRLNQPGLTPPQCPWGQSWRWPQVESGAARRCRRGKCRSSRSPPVLQAHNHQAQAFTNKLRLTKRGNVCRNSSSFCEHALIILWILPSQTNLPPALCVHYSKKKLQPFHNL